ncbi:MAG TPA: hypothetical protein VF238_02685 [Methylomirabilota bacterium]
MKLVSESLSLDDYDDAVELFFERGWTDGLPVVLPTRRRVEAMIAHVGRDPQESLGPVPPKGGEATTIGLGELAQREFIEARDLSPRSGG